MRAFAALYAELDATNSTAAKVSALRRYFITAPPADAAWAVWFLIGRRPRMAVPARVMAGWASERADVPEWLFGACYEAVGDLAETMALLVPGADDARVPGGPGSSRPLAELADELLRLPQLTDDLRRARLLELWAEQTVVERLVWNKLITGQWRVGVSQRLVTRALADASGLDAPAIAHRLMGAWEPTAAFYAALVSPTVGVADESRPYPFLLAHPLLTDPSTLGPVEDWQAEWKWDGIRAQLVRRNGTTYLWTRGEELAQDRFPEIEAASTSLTDGTVLDGEVLPWRGGVMPFAQLQHRIGRTRLTASLLDQVPVVFLAFDLMEESGRDIRDFPLAERRGRLEAMFARGMPSAFRMSELAGARSWPELEAVREGSRDRGVEGLMLKRRDAPYGVGRPRGLWWKWKIDPLTVDAVLIYAQPGSGRRASLFTDYTFGLWDAGRSELVPVAKAYSGLTDAEIREVDRFVRANTLERFGPVRHVRPELVFELAFETVRRSKRHRSGLAVRFPRIARWRSDKLPEDADTVVALWDLLPPSERESG